jgi:AcrR family transcriptional regulator
MVARPRADRIARRAELTSVAAAVFSERGVANTAVSDIVKAAGVAQGTFYLYFDSKDDILLAVVELIVAQMVAAIDSAFHMPGASAVEKLLALSDIFVGFDTDPSASDLTDFMHRPENRALHDRMAEQFTPALFPFVESIVEQGVAEGAFEVPDTVAAAWFVLGGLQSAELSGATAAEMPASLHAATHLALRALGYQGAIV